MGSYSASPISLKYHYALVPGLMLGVSIWFQGLPGTLEAIASIIREVRFQLSRTGWGI
jgi:hypothetical protein